MDSRDDSLGRREVQRDAVDAVTLACRRRPVGKHVTKVAAAPAAVRFCPRHEEAAIRRRPDCALERREKTGPARAALELPIGDEKRLPARGAPGWWHPGVNLLGCVLFGVAAIAGYVVPTTGSMLDLAAANWNTSAGAACFLACALGALVAPRRRA